MTIYLDLTREFNRGRLRTIICSGQAVVLHRLARALGGRVPLVGVGGIHSGEDARAKIDAGATLTSSGLVRP